jgi:hypothetical protein
MKTILVHLRGSGKHCLLSGVILRQMSQPQSEDQGESGSSATNVAPVPHVTRNTCAAQPGRAVLAKGTGIEIDRAAAKGAAQREGTDQNRSRADESTLAFAWMSLRPKMLTRLQISSWQARLHRSDGPNQAGWGSPPCETVGTVVKTAQSAKMRLRRNVSPWLNLFPSFAHKNSERGRGEVRWLKYRRSPVC